MKNSAKIRLMAIKEATLYVEKEMCKKNIRNGNIFLFKVKESNFVPKETDWKAMAWDKFRMQRKV